MAPIAPPAHSRRNHRRAGLLALATLMGLLGAQARADDPAAPPAQPWLGKALADKARSELRDTSITLGAGYIQGTFKADQNTASPGLTELTDNGKLNLLLDLSTRDKALARVPMKTGSLILGWNITGSLGQFKADRQLENSAITGTDAGTSVKGQYAVLAPSLFVRLGPLYPGRDIYWSFGVGLGGGAVRYQGNAQFTGNPPAIQAVGANGKVKPTLYETAFWQLDVGHWVVVFNGKYFLIRDPNLSSVTYEIYGLSLGYRITF